MTMEINRLDTFLDGVVLGMVVKLHQMLKKELFDVKDIKMLVMLKM